MKRLKREYCSICGNDHIPGGAHVFDVRRTEGVRYVEGPPKPKAKPKRGSRKTKPVSHKPDVANKPNVANKSKGGAYRYRDQEARRAYQRELMRKRRAKVAVE